LVSGWPIEAVARRSLGRGHLEGPAALAAAGAGGGARRQRPRLDGKRRFHWRNAGTDVEESLRGPHWAGG